MRHARTVGVALLVVLFSCSRKSADRPSADSAGMSAASDSSTTLKGMAMLPSFRANADSLAANPSMMRSSMARHRAEVESVVKAMHEDMMGTRMHSDAAYEALADSVVQGAASLGTASGPDFDNLVMRHVDQMRRLAAVYENMASSMK